MSKTITTSMTVAINGFGRIGKNFLRALLADERARKKIRIAAINIGPADPFAVAHAFKYDSILGTFSGDVRYHNQHLIIVAPEYTISIVVLAEKDINAINWGEYAIDWVVDCSGRFTHAQDARKHIDRGAKKVLISAPAKEEDITIIPGINHTQYDSNKHTIVSLGSCTTNAFVPMIDVIDKVFGIESAHMTTVHAYTNSQHLLDVDGTEKDLRKDRAAALNIIPTSTGATKVVGKILPQLEGKITGTSLRVPVPVVSLVDVCITLKKNCTVDAINGAYAQAADGTLYGILEYTEVPLVSSDFAGNAHSVIIDGKLTQAFGNTAKIFGWYDNEWGYSNRLKDFLLIVN